VIYQSGYLTIKGHDERFGIYRLGFPNREVEEGFIRFLLPYYANVNKVESPFEILKFVREVRAGDYESFFRRLQSFFSDIPYELARELELHCQNGYGSSSNLVVISFLFQLSSSFLILLKVVDMFAF